MQSQTIGKLAEALSKAQAEMGSAKKDSVNPFFNRKYADLASVIEAIKEPLSKNGLSYTQPLIEENEKIYVVTKLLHISGEWIESRLRLFMSKTDMQALGGAITYGRRYALSAIVGLTQDDDDAESNMQREKNEMHVKKKIQHQKSSFQIGPKETQRIKELCEINKMTGAQLAEYVLKQYECKFNELEEFQYESLIDSLMNKENQKI